MFRVLSTHPGDGTFTAFGYCNHHWSHRLVCRTEHQPFRTGRKHLLMVERGQFTKYYGQYGWNVFRASYEWGRVQCQFECRHHQCESSSRGQYQRQWSYQLLYRRIRGINRFRRGFLSLEHRRYHPVHNGE